MFRSRTNALFALTAIAALLTCPIAEAQTSDAPASTPKQIRKAERKAARAKRNTELKKLEQNGYKPQGGDNPNYPQNAQDAERKANAPAAASAP
jgi:hypothetical protein